MTEIETTKRAKELQLALSVLRRAKFNSHNESGIRNGEKHLLMLISMLKSESDLTPSEIAKSMGVTMPAITHVLNALEKEGLLTRQIVQDDKRMFHIALTEKGMKYVKEIEKEYFDTMYELVSFLGEEDSMSLIQLLGKIQAYMNGKKSRC